MASEGKGRGVASFGERLKREREKKGITIEEIAQITKISGRNLRALEDEQFAKLPGGIFNRGFVRAYARHLGIDEEQAVSDYLEAAGESPPEPTDLVPQAMAAAAEARESRLHDLPWGWVTLVVVLLAVLLAGWGMYSSRHVAPRPVTTSAPESTNAPSPETIPPQPTPTAPDTSIAPPAPSATTSIAEEHSVATSGGFDIALHARADVWVSVSVDGERVLDGVLSSGQLRTIHARHQVVLKVGNAAGLDVTANGKSLGTLGKVGEVRTLTFTGKAPEAASTSGSGTTPNR
jgi:cytoskeleton protein RodZ